MDRCEEEVVGAHHVDELAALRQVVRQLFQQGGDLFVDLGGIGSGHLKGEECYARFAVEVAVKRVRECAELYVGHVFEAQHRAVVTGAYHYVLELLYAFETSAILHGVLEDIGRVGAQRAGGSLYVLLAEHCR